MFARAASKGSGRRSGISMDSHITWKRPGALSPGLYPGIKIFLLQLFRLYRLQCAEETGRLGGSAKTILPELSED
jgi:hypothetical protein